MHMILLPKRFVKRKSPRWSKLLLFRYSSESSDFGRCLCANSVAGGALRDDDSIPQAISFLNSVIGVSRI